MLRFINCLLILQYITWATAGLGNYPNGPQNQKELVQQLRIQGHIKSDRVAEVMTLIDRKFYFENSTYQDMENYTDFAYYDMPPFMHAFVLENLKEHLVEGNRVLDVGSASGYLTACMAVMVGKTGLSVGIEHVPALIKQAKECVLKNTYLQEKQIKLKFVEGDEKMGVPEDGPYDAINVAFAFSHMPPKLIGQLKEGGRMIIKFGSAGHVEEMQVVDKQRDGTVNWTDIRGEFCVHRKLFFEGEKM